jgi:ketopantoate reductase
MTRNCEMPPARFVRLTPQEDGQRSDAGCWTRLEACVKETCAVGVAEGAQVAPEPILAAPEGAPDAFRSSMQKDVAAGWAPELDAISGPIVRGGHEHGVDVSATKALVDLIARVV